MPRGQDRCRHRGDCGTQHPKKALTRCSRTRELIRHGQRHLQAKRGYPDGSVQLPHPLSLQDTCRHTDYNCFTLQNVKTPFTVRCKPHHRHQPSGVQEQVQAKVQLKVRCLSTNRQHRKPVCNCPRLLNRAKCSQEGWRIQGGL